MPRRSTARSEEKRIRQRFIRDLEREGERIVKRISDQLVKDIESQIGSLTESATRSSGRGGFSNPFDSGSLVRLFGSALTFVLSRPRTSRTTRETERSREAEQRFRLSRRQGLAEAGIELNRGEKNL